MTFRFSKEYFMKFTSSFKIYEQAFQNIFDLVSRIDFFHITISNMNGRINQNIFS